MSNITKEAVMDLAEKTGAGLIDCKRALAETNGDMEEAISILRKKVLLLLLRKQGEKQEKVSFLMQLVEIEKRNSCRSEL